MGAKPKRGKKVVDPDRTRIKDWKQFKDLGFRPILAEFWASGKTPKEIRREILHEFNVDIPSRLISLWIEHWKRHSLDKVVAATMKDELNELHREALKHYNWFQAKFREFAEPQLDEETGTYKMYDEKVITFYGQQFEKWWENIGKFHLQGVKGPQVEVKQTFNLQGLLEEVKDHPEIAKRLAKRLDPRLAGDETAGSD